MKMDTERTITLKDQIKRFAIESLYGFNTIILIGMGRKLGIFDYFYIKGKKVSISDYTAVRFTPDEISENLGLDREYLDAWIHLALECDLLEIDDPQKKWLRTSPYIYELLIDCNHKSYVGGTLGAFYNIALIQDLMLNNFKTGKTINLLQLPPEIVKELQERSKRFGNLIHSLFAKNYKDFCEKLKENGTILEVGCGYGYNLETWANAYKKAQFVGIDIDSIAIESTQEMLERNNWNQRVKLIKSSIHKYKDSVKKKFDLIILNQVFHEMNLDEDSSIVFFQDLYALLKDEGILLVGETMVPDTFAPKSRFRLFDITHKFSEAGSAHFYNEKTFREFIESTQFTKAEFIKEGGTYFWVVQK
ncbi:MAG: class I SAM-dependent methyltransferase [Promethearchaeota archaeon]